LSEETTYEIPCQQCGHSWKVVLEQLERIDQQGVWSPQAGPRVVPYRARCPKCHFYNILEVLVEEEGGDG
jgi:hypothetical protein